MKIGSISQQQTQRRRKRGRNCSFEENDIFLQEWEALRILKKNSHVVDLIDVFESNDEIHLVMEYCNGGELYHRIQKKLSSLSNEDVYTQNETEAAEMITQILKVLKDLHDRDIAHCDIKPENLLLTTKGTVSEEPVKRSTNNSFEIKLCDFGSAQFVDNEQEGGEEGYESNNASNSSIVSSDNESYPQACRSSNIYEAPELFINNRRRSCASTAVDIYSLGVTLYVLLDGFPPVFDTEGVIIFPSSPRTSKCAISEDAKDLIRSMLLMDPKLRITARKALESTWIKRNIYPNLHPTRSLSSSSLILSRRRLKQRSRSLSLSFKNTSSSSISPSQKSTKRRRLSSSHHQSNDVSPVLLLNMCRTLENIRDGYQYTCMV